MNNHDINEFLPSILNPRTVKKQHGSLALTQNSIVSRCSLSLKRKNRLPNVKNGLHKTFPPLGKENGQVNRSLLLDNNNVLTKNVDKDKDSLNFSLTQELHPVISTGKENLQNALNSPKNKTLRKRKTIDEISIGFSAVEDLNTNNRDNNSSEFSFGGLLPVNEDIIANNNDTETLIALSSYTELEDNRSDNTLSTIILDTRNKNLSQSTIDYEVTENPVVSVSFSLTGCEAVNVNTNNSIIKNIIVTNKDNAMNVDCEVEESRVTVHSINDDVIELSSEDESPPNKRAATVNLEIKKKTWTENPKENLKVLILNTDAIERLSHVIVQPPNYKLVKRKISDRSKFQNNGFRKPEVVNNGKLVRCSSLKQKRIDSYFVRPVVSETVVSAGDVVTVSADDVDMSKISGGAEGVRCDRTSHKSSRREVTLSPRSRQAYNAPSPQAQSFKGTTSDQRNAQKVRNDSASSSPRKHIDSIQFSLPPKSTSTKNSIQQKAIPYHKFVAGTHFAVDAFSYGDIPQVKNYFLTHFHSDHYSGLKKSFNKNLFCSKITAELCITRLGVNSKCIHIINFDEKLTIDGIEVTAVDANHCPGALMLVFSLPNGKTLLHTGDFRASPQMESYPVFWNKDIHTIYLDSTYCNPRYDFPTQEQCLEMALYLLRQKKLALEKAGRKFSSVLIVCGTYTIGKEKFFMGMARRVACNVWACPEKDKVLQAVEGRSFGLQPPAACQLHVVPMRDLTHEKLRAYLESLQGSFSEVVAFKPSGWENGKNSTVEKDSVTIHGIPYSEHSSFSEMIRFVKFLQPKQVVPTVDISGGLVAVQKYFPCPLVGKETSQNQSKVTEYFSKQHQHVPAVT